MTHRQIETNTPTCALMGVNKYKTAPYHDTTPFGQNYCTNDGFEPVRGSREGAPNTGCQLHGLSQHGCSDTKVGEIISSLVCKDLVLSLAILATSLHKLHKCATKNTAELRNVPIH